MPAMRVSVTELDSFLYYQASDDASFDEFRAQLLGHKEQTEPMKVGHAFASLRERMGTGEFTELQSEGYTFFFDLDLELGLPPAREIKEEIKLQIAGVDVTLVGKVDAVAGLIVYDDKFTENYDPDRYFDSYQWRCYLHMFGAKKFVYNVFVGKIKGLDVYVNDFHSLPLYSYPEIGSDVHHVLTEFVEFCKANIPERITQ